MVRQLKDSKKIQDIINKGARAITGILKNTFIEILQIKADFRLVKVLLDFKQKKFSARIAALTDENFIKNILSITFRNGNKSAWPNKQPINNINQVKRNRKEKNQLNI